MKQLLLAAIAAAGIALIAPSGAQAGLGSTASAVTDAPSAMTSVRAHRRYYKRNRFQRRHVIRRRHH